MTTEMPEAQEAFVGLLTRPLVTVASDPTLHRLIRRHQRTLTPWAVRCGYRLVVVGDAARLHRVPLGGRVEHPTPHPTPTRRVLVLALAAAAACEEGEPTTTIQAIADAVRDITGVDGAITGFDPDRRPERILLLQALELLEHFGALRRRTFDDDMVRNWEEDHEGIGRGYEVDRAALLQLVDPAVVANALADDSPGGSAASQRLLRRLLETQAVLYAELTDDEAEFLRNRRGRIIEDAVRMTGGTVEIRAEGLLLILPIDARFSDAGTIDWPKANAASWSALLLADAAMTTAADHIDADGVLVIDTDEVGVLAEALYEEREHQLTKKLREDPTRLRPTAERILSDAGLLQVQPNGDWRLLPTAARYREPAIVVGPRAGGDDD